MDLTVDILGIPELETEFNAVHGRLVIGLRQASLMAAAAGVEAARADHPYTDRTYHLSGDAHAEQSGDDDFGQDIFRTEADMVWPVEYASFVDKGTSRNAAYPFTPQAAEKAGAVLEAETNRAVEAALEGLR